MASKVGFKPVSKIGELRRAFGEIKTTTAGDVRFIAQAALFTAEMVVQVDARLAEIASLLRVAAQRQAPKPRRKPSAWNLFFAEGMKAGKTPAQIGAEWRQRQRVSP